MNWRWRHIIPEKDVFDEIIDLDQKIKKVIYGEWSSLKSGSRRTSSGLYSREGTSDYEIKIASRLPISIPRLNEYILSKARDFNMARPNFKDVYLCPFGCHVHLVGADKWETRPDGVDYFINGRFFNIRRGNQSRQILPARALEVGDYVASVVKADAGYELAIPDEISYVDFTTDDFDGLCRVTYPHLVDLITERGFRPVDQLFVRMTESDAQGVVAAMKRHVEALPLPPPPTGRSSPSVGNNRIIDLGGL